jgi:hypothetical protein
LHCQSLLLFFVHFLFHLLSSIHIDNYLLNFISQLIVFYYYLSISL